VNLIQTTACQVEGIYVKKYRPFCCRQSTLLWCTSGTLLIPYCVQWHLVSPLLFMWNLNWLSVTKSLQSTVNRDRIVTGMY